MARNLNNPLDSSDFDQIEKSLTTLNDLEKAVNKAKRAGIDVTGKHEEIREARKRLEAIKREYRPA